jgi:hypothetical protein
MDFLTSVGIGIGFLLKCRFSVMISIGFGIEKKIPQNGTGNYLGLF